MGDEHLDGWTVPVYRGVAEPLLLGGVPPLFLVSNFLATLLLFFVEWRVLLVGGALHLSGVALTAWEPRWWSILKAYWQYAAYYEG